MINLVDRLIGEIGKQRKRVVILGDVMIDRWVHGHLAPCQDNCPKFVQEEIVEVPGGAANAERCLSQWGAQTALYGQVQNECPIKTRYVEDGRIVFRADNDGPVQGWRWVRDLALEMVQCASGVLLSDYDKGFLTPDYIKEVVAVCQKHGILCVADAKRGPEVYEGCILKANFEWQRKNRGWMKTVKTVFIGTNGENAPDVWTIRDDGEWRNNSWEVVPGEIITLSSNLPCTPCINHVGAGDCFAAHLTLALTYGLSLREAAVLAHSAGRVYVQFQHNRPPHPSEIAADLASVT